MTTDEIMTRASQLRLQAYTLGFTTAEKPWNLAIGVYDLWASADKATCYANLGFVDQSRAYLRDAEESLARITRLKGQTTPLDQRCKTS